MKKEKIVCVLCHKQMKEEEWTWGASPDDAHRKCILGIVNSICSADCGFFDVTDGDCVCRECGADMRPITEADKERWRKQ